MAGSPASLPGSVPGVTTTGSLLPNVRSDRAVVNYLDELAREIYRAAHPGHELPAGQARLYRGYAVLARTVGERVSCANVHDAWVAWAIESMPNHPSLLPLSDLAADVRIKD